jgi:hypothetical protein
MCSSNNSRCNCSPLLGHNCAFKIDKDRENENIAAEYVPACNLGRPHRLIRVGVLKVALEAVEIHCSSISALDLFRNDR